MIYSLYTDGGARGNPGPGAIGVVIYDENKNKIYELSKYIGMSTNNEAEYTSLIEGIGSALDKGIKNLNVFMDSELIIKQVNGSYKVKNERLKVFYNKLVLLRKKFDFINFVHIKREENKQADLLVNEALDKNGR
ncbi:hypothetical protein A2V49_00500 [candidate division WWE3 bacterium RBG_19FT_COMBO_34_6]|uniref:RNase H type-1 domain-containing protein n=1 Tax=candidate division WWE3 bacterium RBG_19FT_COMBO_34_6 TaxID=1802612 RepID=A0A1F4UNH0_UNCKA|nr:MAG: hypothetical protein A2V49_00500 [candidate division WWE3 bacterium RBG_19FT_COMBO_34_6]